MVKCGVLFEIRPEFLNNIQTSVGFKGLIRCPTRFIRRLINDIYKDFFKMQINNQCCKIAYYLIYCIYYETTAAAATTTITATTTSTTTADTTTTVISCSTRTTTTATKR
jgi:hypothetical protein